jgi:hypothetical protein
VQLLITLLKPIQTEANSSRGDKWWVNGYHFYYPSGKERLDVMTSVGDCSIYDGWWD